MIAGVAFCFKHLSPSGVITNLSIAREKQLEIPCHALREALINALCDRHWKKYNLIISLAIYEDRIEIASPGAFPPQTQESISQKILRIPYENPDVTLSDVASEVGSTRDGIRKITNKLRAKGCLIREGSTKGSRWIVVNKKSNDAK